MIIATGGGTARRALGDAMTVTLIQGDCLAVLPTLAAGSVDAVVTDPPYQVGLNKGTCGWDVWPGQQIWEECRRVLKPSGLLVWSIAPHVAHERIGDVLAAGFKVLEVGFWVYGSGRPVNVHRVKRNYDLVYFMATTNRKLFSLQARTLNRSGSTTGQKGRLNPFGGIGRQFQKGIRGDFYYGEADYFPSNVACEEHSDAFGQSDYDVIFAVKRLLPITPQHETHPTAKPVDLIAQQIKLVSQPGDVVLDPFMGSGTTGVAAKALGRDFIGVDLNPAYVAMAERRIAGTQEPLFR